MVPPHLATKPSVLVICGPTGSGKGQLGRSLAVRLNGEVISADSRKIYRGFDIGTAKPSLEDRRRIPHHLVDICEPGQVFTAGRFAELADAVILEIGQRGRVPLVVGGTGLYHRALLYGIVDAPSRDDHLRAKLMEEEARHPGSLYKQLTRVDPVAAAQLFPTDMVRIVRAMEVYSLTGQRISDMQADHGFQELRYRVWQIIPDWPRDELYARIDARVDRMMEQGWLEEVAGLCHSGLDSSPAFQAVGYRQLKDYLESRVSLQEAVASIKIEHRRYAKRQLMWYRAVPDIQWLPTPVDEDRLGDQLIGFFRST